MKFLIRDNYIEVHFDPDLWHGQGRALVKYMCSTRFEIDFERWLKAAHEKLATEIAANEAQCKVHGKGTKECRLHERI